MSNLKFNSIASFVALTTAIAFVATSSSTPARSVPTGPPTFSNPLTITNSYFPFTAGGVKSYTGKSDGDAIAVVDVYDATTRTFTVGLASVDAHQLREVEFEKGKLTEISTNYFAQGDDGAVYYFGEVVDTYTNGVVTGHGGSWLVGGPTLPSDPVETANAPAPALFMPANPELGDQFKPEDLAPTVDETDTVVAVLSTFKVDAGKFHDVIKVKETSAIESGHEFKWYAPGVGVLKAKGDGEELELIASTFSSP